MNKNRTLLISSLLCLLPIVFSLIVYTELPDQIAIHWNAAGEADNYVSKTLAAFGMPILFLIIHIAINKICDLCDPNKELQKKAKAGWQILTWTLPALSIILTSMTLIIAMGNDLSVIMVVSLMLGVLLIISGNYLPKTRRNSFIGIKLPWTLHDDDNWNKTHKLSGYVFIICGLMLIITSFVFENATAFIISITGVVLVTIIIPSIYSYSISKKKSDK